MTRTTAAMGIGGRVFAKVSTGMRKIGAALVLGLLATPASAQGQFDPVARVDDEVITQFQFTQRMAFLTLLRAPGDIPQLTMDQLINETLQMREARLKKVEVAPELITAGMEEFAKRGNLEVEQLIELLGQAGVASETFRDFVAAGVTWREVLKATVLPTVSLSKAEIAQAMTQARLEPGLRVLLSEIELPAGDPATAKASRKRAERLRSLDEDGFTDAAKRFSIGPSRVSGGEMKWLDITALPPEVIAAVRGLKAGQASRIVEAEESIKIYFMRDREEISRAEPRTVVDYAALLLAGGRSEANLAAAAEMREEFTSCDDFYPVARGLPPEQLIRETQPESAVPAPYRAAIDRLDAGEMSTDVVTTNGAMVVLMLCSRGNEIPTSLTEAEVSDQLRNTRIGTLGQMRLDELRANARIEILR